MESMSVPMFILHGLQTSGGEKFWKAHKCLRPRYAAQNCGRPSNREGLRTVVGLGAICSCKLPMKEELMMEDESIPSTASSRAETPA
jgi:hypothetical protein